ncbi:MAG: diacylglycerol kinase family protein, partial [Kofleriaceae bacterium]
MRAVAIVNGTLPRVRGPLGRALERAWPGRVRITGSLGHARAAIRDELARGVDLIAFGGGDGTVVMGLALLAEACRGWARPEPAIGALRLGATSAIARALGATDDPVADLARLVRGAGAWRPVAMIEALGL